MLTSPYQGYKTGSGAPIPINQQTGAVDINALIGGMVDRGFWQYYYRLSLAVSTTIAAQYTLFNAANGSADPYPLVAAHVLTQVETNMPNSASNGFNPPRDLVLDQIGFSFSADTRLVDQITFCKYSYFELKIIDKVFYGGHIDQYPSGGGIGGFSTQDSESAWNIGTPNPHATRRFSANLCKYIAPQMNWSLVLYFPPTSGPAGAAPSTATAANGGNGVTLDIYLNGLTDRAVQ
jgi:hypothetical protein